MSETMGHALHDPLDDLSRGRGRRALALFGAVGVAVLLLVALLVPGGTTEPLPPTTTTAVEDDEAPDDAAPDDPASDPDEDTEVREELPTVTYEIYLARDPFEPVVPADLPQPDVSDPDGTGDPGDPTEPGDPGDPSDPGDPGDPSDPRDPSDPSDPSDPGDPGDPSDPRDPSDPSDPGDPDDSDRCEGEEEVVCDGEVVSLVEITEDDRGRLAVIQVDTTVYEVRTGEVFADRYRLLEIGTDRVRVLFGDQDFSLREDQSVLK